MPSSIQFWSNDISSLFNKDYIFELWPTPNMTFEQKLNAITRLIIILTILGFIVTMSIKILLIGVITMFVLYMMYNTRKSKVTQEMFTNNNTSSSETMVKRKGDVLTNPVTLNKILKEDFQAGSKTNPYSNVLLTDIADTPQRNPAPPAFNPEVYDDIQSATKKMVQKLNPDIDNTSAQLFGDLADKYDLDKSCHAYYSTANTRVSNDQGAFADFLYGNMPSGKEGGSEGAMERVKYNTRYLLY